MATQKKQTRGALWGAAWEVATYYRAHRAYGSESRACKALQRRCPGFTARKYQNAFQQALVLYDTAVELVARDAAELLRQTDVDADRFPDFRYLVAEIRQCCPGFQVSTYRSSVLWVFMWHHLM